MSSPEIAGLMDQYWAARLDAISVIVDRAIGRGEIPAATDPAAFMHAVAAFRAWSRIAALSFK